MKILDRGRVGFFIEANGNPSEVYVSKSNEDTYNLALSVDHGQGLGKVYYLFGEGSVPKQYETLDEARKALTDLADLPEGSTYESRFEELEVGERRVDISDEWSLVFSKPTPIFSFAGDESDKVDWRGRESRNLLKQLSTVVE